MEALTLRKDGLDAAFRRFRLVRNTVVKSGHTKFRYLPGCQGAAGDARVG